jgi:hypothetical protein
MKIPMFAKVLIFFVVIVFILPTLFSGAIIGAVYGDMFLMNVMNFLFSPLFIIILIVVIIFFANRKKKRSYRGKRRYH